MERSVSTITSVLYPDTTDWVTENNGHIAAVDAAIAEIELQEGFVLFTNYGASMEEVIQEDGSGYRTTTAIITFISKPTYRVTVLNLDGSLIRLGFNDNAGLFDYLTSIEPPDYELVTVSKSDGTIWEYTGADSLATYLPELAGV